MEPNLLAHLTPEEQAAWTRCKYAATMTAAEFTKHAVYDLPATLTALAQARAVLTEARGVVERYGGHDEGCPAQISGHGPGRCDSCPCDCGFDTARTGREGR